MYVKNDEVARDAMKNEDLKTKKNEYNSSRGFFVGLEKNEYNSNED